MKKKLLLSALGMAVVPSAMAAKPKQQKPQRMNVLFLISDDMRTELNTYGRKQAITPNLDRLAAQGVRFDRAYCQYPLSGPSRASLLTGRRPTTSKLYSNREWFGATYPDWVSLPKYFKQQGYLALRSGKVFHGGIDDTEAWNEGGEPRRWSFPVDTAIPKPLTQREILAHYDRTTTFDMQRAKESDRWEALTGEAAKNHGDNKTAEKAIDYIRRCKASGDNFFIACGFSKPHTPFVAPKEFFDLYSPDTLRLPVDFASLPMVPTGFPAGSIRTKNADLFINRSASPEESRDMIRAYLACVSFVDWNVGRVLAELDAQGLRESTIIVFWGDHGYQLGEKGKWSKAGSLWEQGARVPFIILDPRANGNGHPSPRVVELVDIYPTLVDLCGLPQPDGLDGVSLRPLLANPDTAWNRPAYTLWNEHGKGVTGVAVRTERWRYAEFFGIGAGRFLTDPLNDVNEIRNLAHEPQYRSLVDSLHRMAIEYVKGQQEMPVSE